MSDIDMLGSPYVYSESQQHTLDELAQRIAAMRASGDLKPDVLHNIRKCFRIKNIYQRRNSPIGCPPWQSQTISLQ